MSIHTRLKNLRPELRVRALALGADWADALGLEGHTDEIGAARTASWASDAGHFDTRTWSSLGHRRPHCLCQRC